MAYYTSGTCRDGMHYGCTTSYAQSAVKSIVEAWATSKFTNSELKTVDGYSARLLQFSELLPGLGYTWTINSAGNPQSNGDVPNWVYGSNYAYWTMTPGTDGDQPSSSYVWRVDGDGTLDNNSVDSSSGALRPVINVYKSAISS